MQGDISEKENEMRYEPTQDRQPNPLFAGWVIEVPQTATLLQNRNIAGRQSLSFTLTTEFKTTRRHPLNDTE